MLNKLTVLRMFFRLFGHFSNSLSSVSLSKERVEAELGGPTKVSDRKAAWTEIAVSSELSSF